MPEQHCDICREIPCENPVDYQTYSLESPLVFTSGTLSAVAFCPVGFTCSPGVSPHTFTYDDEDWTIPVPPSTVTNGGPLILKGCSSDIVRFVTPGMTAAQIAALAQEMFAEAAQQQADCDMTTLPGVTRNPETEDFNLSALTPSTTCENTAYSGTITSTEEATFSIIGTLPAGLTLSPGTPTTTATISGTPTTIGTTVFVIAATSGSETVYRQVTFRVVGITTASPLPDANDGAAYSETVAASMSGTLVWSATGLPPGLSINSASGLISGTVTAGSTGTFAPSITVSNGTSTCVKVFSMEVVSGACCFANTAFIPVVSGPSPSCYAVTDDRIIVIGTVDNLIFINATTDTVASTVPAFGTVPSFLIYSPVNNRVYCLDISNGDMLVINPTTMAHIGTIASPAAALQFGEPCYDATNDLIYWLASDILTNNYIFRLNPVTGIADVLATIPLPVAPAVQNWGKRCDHCSTNNRIYAPVFDDDGLGSLTASIQVYNIAGVLQTTVATPGVVTSSSSGEMVYWDVTNSVLYYISDNAVSDAPGVVVINPADNSTLDTVALAASGVGSACLSPDCLSLNVLTGLAGVYSLSQINTGDYSSICTTSVGMTAITGALQVTSFDSKVYVPDVLGVRVVVMTP